MAESHIIVIAELSIKAEYIDQAKELILHVIPLSRNDSGCWYYDFFQDQTAENQFILLEHWSNKAAWDLHIQKDYVQKLIKDIAAYLAEPVKIRWFTTVD